MKSENTRLPLIALLILILSSFIPIIPIIILHLNGLFLSAIEMPFGGFNEKLLNNINIIGAIICLMGYLFARKLPFKILWILLTIFFLSSFISFATQNWNYESYPYFLPLIIQAIVEIAPLYLIGHFKEKKVLSK
jgi:hypothetical protein